MLKFKLMGHWQLRQLPKGSEPCLNQWRHQLAGVQRHQHRWHSPTDPAIRMHNFNTSTCPNQVATCKSKHHVQASHQIIQTSQKKKRFRERTCLNGFQLGSEEQQQFKQLNTINHKTHFTHPAQLPPWALGSARGTMAVSQSCNKRSIHNCYLSDMVLYNIIYFSPVSKVNTNSKMVCHTSFHMTSRMPGWISQPNVVLCPV